MGAAGSTIAVAIAALLATPVAAQDNLDELAKKLSNPLADMALAPFQFNADFGLGPDGDGEAQILKIQPVLPIHLSQGWTLLSRTVIPLTSVEDVFRDRVSGIGNTEQSFFFSPTLPGGFAFGAGPVFALPATDERLGSEEWGAGPTAVGLVQRGHWTVGTLVNQVWSFENDDRPEGINQLFLQPFVSYQLGHGRTLSLDAESSYDWTADEWTVPVNLSFTKVFRVGRQPMSFQVGARYYVEAPEDGPEWGLRSTLSFLFPQGR